MKKDKELLDQELRDLSPFLRDMRGKDDGFRIPENYFESLEDDVFTQIDALGARRKVNGAKNRTTLLNWLGALWQPRIALALGSLTLVAVAAWWWLKPQPAAAPEVLPIANIELTPEELEAYVLENVTDFEPEQLAALAVLEEEPADPASNNPSQSTTTPKKTKVDTDDLSPEELEILINDLTDEEIEKML
ncbi:MAG TPA: hypothetical protein PKL15_03325 [Saprospiraceae bacterium]|nr:hypothetical protein [Saprospiraceae bacterium]HNM24429.1 hypothetical protein [Saprospiraceae bacterium]